MNAEEWIAKQTALTESPYKPFQKAVCPVTGKLAELDPVCGLSLDGLASKARRGEVEPPLGWALTKAIGFETRFHKVRVSNVTFRTLHPGYTLGSMLVCFSEDETWMRNLNTRAGELDLGGRTQSAVENLWRDFVLANVRNLEFVYLPESDDESELISYAGEVRVNGVWLSFRPPTAAGAVVDVPNVYATGSEPAEMPCEIPLSLRDCDYLYTAQLMGEITPGLNLFQQLGEKFFGSNGKPAMIERLLSVADVSLERIRDYTEAGHGFLAICRGECEAYGVPLRIPGLELRGSVSS